MGINDHWRPTMLLLLQGDTEPRMIAMLCTYIAYHCLNRPARKKIEIFLLADHQSQCDLFGMNKH